MKTSIKGSILLFTAAVIWGCSFVAQEEAIHIGAFAFNGVRFLIGGAVLLPVIFLLRRAEKRKAPAAKTGSKKRLFFGGILCGILLSLAANLQNFGIFFNAEVAVGDSGKAGFITAMYIMIVPLIGLFFGRKLTPGMVLSILIAVAGLYLICVTGTFTVAKGDIFLLLCSLAFSLHIMTVDYWSQFSDGVALSSIQFFTAGVISCILMFLFETPDPSAILKAYLPLLYSGVMSSGVAYTFQVIGQKYCEPTVASMLMSLEALFAMLAACVFYGITPSLREGLGCLLMLIAIFLIETPFADRFFQKLRRKKAA